MSKTPQYILDGFRPHGPGLCRCRCGKVVSTNAFARAKHECDDVLSTEDRIHLEITGHLPEDF